MKSFLWPPFAAYVLIAVCVAWPLNTGMIFHDYHAIYSESERPAHYRRNLGLSIVFGLQLAVIWPMGTPAIWCATGFAEHGVWSQK